MSHVYPSDARRLPAPRRALETLVRLGDRASSLVGVPAAATRLLAERRAWGPLQVGPPRSRPATKRLALSFDLDYQADTDALPELQRLVEDAGARMSVVAIGKLVEQDPGPYREAVQDGHEIVNHTWSHPDNPVLCPDREFWHLDAEEMRDEARRAQDVFERHLGVRPRGFRSPHFKDAHRMLEALESIDELDYLSSTLSSATPTGLPYFPACAPVAGDDSHRVAPSHLADASRLLMVPLTPCPAHRWDPLCTYHALRQPPDPRQGRAGHGPDGLRRLWVESLERADEDAFASYYFDPMDLFFPTASTLATSAPARAFRAMLDDARDRGWRLETLGAVADAWRPHAAPRGGNGEASVDA